MAEKCKDFSKYGNLDERFETVLSENLHCAKCSNVFKDPVMCKNEHCFCRACITEHLNNSQNCPCCNQHLSVESLSDAPRILRNLLSELRIRCDYHKRGCEEFVQLGNLASHIATCAKAPVVCANDECSCEMSREDQTRHESEECRFRKIKFRNCKEMDSMMQEIGASLGDLCEHVTKLNTNVNEKLSEMKTGLSAMENRFEKGYEKVETNLEEMQSKFEKLENRFEKVRNQCHESFHDMQPTRSDQATQSDLVGEDQVANNPTQNAYIVAGGYGKQGQPLNSVEIFDKSTNSWRQLQPMKKCRADASSVVYNGQLLVTGGISDDRNITSSIEQLVRNPNPFVPPCWLNFPVNLPRALRGHRSVVYNNRLLVIGGYDDEKKSHLIYEIQLHFPYTSKVLAEIPSYTCVAGCGVVLVDDKILIFGGEATSCDGNRPSRSSRVTMFDITKNEFTMLESLPHGVYHMAAVKRGASVVLCGGFTPYFDRWSYARPSTVIRYNIETQKSDMLSRMNCYRTECSGIIDGNSVVVMGGHVSNVGITNTVEALECSEWRNLPSMNEARRRFVAEMV